MIEDYFPTLLELRQKATVSNILTPPESKVLDSLTLRPSFDRYRVEGGAWEIAANLPLFQREEQSALNNLAEG